MTLNDFKKLIRELENAAWSCGTDEYKDGVSYATTKRHGDALDNARRNINNAAEELFTKLGRQAEKAATHADFLGG